MKKFFVLNLIALLGLIIIQSCSNSKSISAKSEGFFDYEEPLTQVKFRTDENYFRARGIGESPDVSFSEKLGEQDARVRISAQIEQVVQEFLKRYDEQYKNELGIDFSGKSEGITRTLTNQTLKSSEIVEFKKQRNQSTGVYRYFVVVEVPKEHIKNALKEQLRSNVSNQERIRLDAKMRMLEEEMDVFIESQNGQQ